MDNSKDWGEFLEGIKAAQQAAEAQKEANEQHKKYERLRFEFTLALINNNDLLHERSFKEICQLGVKLTDEFMKHESEKGKFKIVEGTRVRMVSSKDTHIVEGAYGTVVNPGIRESEVRWDSMLAIRADYRYRNELEDALIIPVYNDLLDPSGNFQIWTPEPIARIYLDDCIKYVGEDTKDLKYGDLLCVYSMTLSEHSLYAIQLSNYKLHKLDTSVCVLEGKGYALAKDTKVKVVLDSTYTEVGQTGKIYRTDYRSALPYEVIMDKGDCVWVAGCTIQNVDTEVYIEEYSADVENEVSPDEDILENGFSRQVTFYEKD